MVLRQEFRRSHEHRTSQTTVRMRTGLDQGQLAIAVRQRLGGPGQLLLRPGGIAERTVGADLDGLTLGIYLAGSFPVLTNGLIGQPRVVSGHQRRVMIKYLLHDMLRDVPVDQDRPQSMTPLIGRQVHRLPVLVADVAIFQPAGERAAVGAARYWPAPVEVAVLPGQ